LRERDGDGCPAEVTVVPGSTSGSGELFAGGGEAGRIMATFDWTGTSVGPVANWPASLRHAVRTVLASRFPMIVLWGPDLLQFYNDAYAPVLGAKHPAIGRDIRRTQPETWDVLSPPIERAMTTLEASWMPGLLLPLERYGFREETYFTVSHAPAFGDAGEVAGIHAVCTEVTSEQLAARRQRLLHDLSTVGGQLRDERETVTAMCAALEGSLDIPFAAVYLAGPGQEQWRRAVVTGCDPRLLPEVLDADGDTAVEVGGLGVTGGPFGDHVTAAVTLPLATTIGGGRMGALVAGRSPSLALDPAYREFFELVAGQFAGALANARAYEAERRRAESLAALDRAKTTFFSDVSHELRTPLTLLLGPVRDVLESTDEALGDDARGQLRLALRNGQRLKRLVNDLLDVASIEAGRAHPTRVATDVAGFTAELAGIFRAAVERAGLELVVDCAPLAAPAHVDPRMWEKVVVNLLSNAVKYTFVGRIEVHLEQVPGGFALVVSDTGVGIPADELPHLFERFHRVAGSAARTREGTGIGLALAHELVALHGGSITVTSEPGVGSRFTVAMPSGEPDEAPSPGPRPSEDARGEAAGWELDTVRPAGTAAAPSGLVLVVDDNPDMRAYLTRVLSPSWDVRTTADGEEALRAVAERCPDVVVTDVMMPRLDGFGLLRALRADPATRDVPVVMLTARAGQEAAVEGLEAGADDYLAKPFQAAELLARVRVAAERGAGGGAPRPVPPADGAPAGPAPAAPNALRVPVPEDAAEVQRDGGADVAWRLPAAPSSVAVLRRRLREVLGRADVEPDHAYDLLLAACEAATNAIEHPQEPTQPFVDVAVTVRGGIVEISVRDHGQWRERTSSMDRGRGSMLMSAIGDVTATAGPTGTTVVIRSPARPGLPSAAC
jgi:signal transduction histidine kinase/ActR/RegA family two-component response regulator